MMKIWAKIVSDNKIVKSKLIIFDFDRILFYELIKKICEEMELETPVVLNKHYEDFKKYKLCRFKQTDFVDKIDFDIFQLERII